MLMLSLLQIFCFSIIFVGNPLTLRLIYYFMDQKILLLDRIQTTDFIWSIDTLPNIYNKREINHFIDVKKIFQKFITLTLFSTFFFKVPDISNTFFITFNVIILLSTCASIYKFKTFWHYFHYPLFSGDTWCFPKNSKILKLFPLELWKKLTLMIFVLFYFLFILCFIV